MLLYRLFGKKTDSYTAAFELLKLLKVRVTIGSLRESLEGHPDFPSMACIVDVLDSYGVETEIIHFRKRDDNTIQSLLKIDPPFIVQMKGIHKQYFTVIKGLREASVEIYNIASQKWDRLSWGNFIESWSGVLLLAETGGGAGEKDHSEHLVAENRNDLLGVMALSTLPLITLLSIVVTFCTQGIQGLWPSFYALFLLAGTVAGGLLLWSGVDAYNPIVRQICSGGNPKVNCNAVLHSKAASIFGTSWSEIGFAYFAGSLLFLLYSGISNWDVLFLLGWLNILALPYTLFSVYYQARVVKQWCRMCVAVQTVLAILFLISLGGGWLTVGTDGIKVGTLIHLLLSYLLAFLPMHFLMPVLKSNKRLKERQMELIRLKHDPRIFNALLEKQKKIEYDANDLGIVLGNPNGSVQLIKVCNPYCGPCAAAHPEVDRLLENNEELQVRVIFTASNKEGDFKAPPVKHLLAIAETKDSGTVAQAMDDWYLPAKKDYDAFAAKYPINGELKRQYEKVEAMRDWCDKVNIAFTPTFFVNGYQLPDLYSVADLKYFLSV